MYVHVRHRAFILSLLLNFGLCMCVCVCVCVCAGVLLRRLEAGLIGISHVIVDEIHERDINVRQMGCPVLQLAILLVTV